MTKSTVAFLGYDRHQTRLCEAIEAEGYAVWNTNEPVMDLSRFDHVVSFGYRHLLRQPIIDTARRPIMNLHISFLPYNRGAHPNFWAWVEGTPHGVTLHEIDAGLDTGPVLASRRVMFDDDLITLRDSQARLISEIESLFIASFSSWVAGDIKPVAQVGKGSFHKAKDLPNWLKTWDISAREAKRKFDAGE
ncbi:MAG: hypothetical protein KJP02_11465 [Octadecabacter sp.]|nr:hypothetical protein [Octadecabacter sp.]